MCLLQVALEGAINSKLAQSSLARGELPQGDLIPWTMGQQFQVRLSHPVHSLCNDSGTADSHCTAVDVLQLRKHAAST